MPSSAPTTTVAPATTGADPGGAEVLDCKDPIGASSAPDEGFAAIGDAVALQTAASSPVALQTSVSGEPDPAYGLFAKTGLLVRTGVMSELIVPPEWLGKVAVAWGNTGSDRPSGRLIVGPCPGTAAWIAFPGGYYVNQPACIDLIVRRDGTDHHVAVGVGSPCPGQQPPPEPSST